MTARLHEFLVSDVSRFSRRPHNNTIWSQLVLRGWLSAGYTSKLFISARIRHIHGVVFLAYMSHSWLAGGSGIGTNTMSDGNK